VSTGPNPTARSGDPDATVVSTEAAQVIAPITAAS
jgi:hypothetical protein